MKRYLSLIPLNDAVKITREHFSRPEKTERIKVPDATGRVTAVPVYSPDSLPSCRIASMDGIAVHSAETRAARDRVPCELEDIVKINTGQVVPDGYDAIIPSEDMGMSESGKIQIRKPARPNQNIRKPGEEIRKGRLILPTGHRIIPADTGALLTYGISELTVRSLTVGLIPTGDELIHHTAVPGPGQVRESNTAMIAALLRGVGITPVCYDIVPDNPALLREVIGSALNAADMVIISAGSSAGTRDHTREVVEELGAVLFHGVAIRPGKSILFGDVQGKPVIGLPGQPVASLTAFREVVMPLLQGWGFQSPPVLSCPARITEPIPSGGGIDEFVPVTVGRLCGEMVLFPRPRGPGGQMHGIRSNGILHIPARKEGYPEGAKVPVRLSRERDDDRQYLILSGYSGMLTDTLEETCSSSDIFPCIRPMSDIGAAVSLCKGSCHGIIVSGGPNFQENEVFSLLKSTCPDHLTMMNIGSVQYGICSLHELSPIDLPHLPTIWYPSGSFSQADIEWYIDQYDKSELIRRDCLKAAGTEEAVIDAIKKGEVNAGFCSGPAAYEADLSFLPICDESRILVYREKPVIVEELSPLLQFLASDRWLHPDHFPPGCIAGEAGKVVGSINPGMNSPGSGTRLQEHSNGVKP